MKKDKFGTFKQTISDYTDMFLLFSGMGGVVTNGIILLILFIALLLNKDTLKMIYYIITLTFVIYPIIGFLMINYMNKKMRVNKK